MLSVSIDPLHDTPERLAEYSRRYSSGIGHWIFATGDADEILKLAGPFGIAVMREGAQLNHNLRTVIVDSAGRVRKVFAGNQWKADEVAEEMKGAMSAGP